MKKSSKQNMENIFSKLGNIQSINPRSNLYESTLIKINQENTISNKWLFVAACGIIFLMSSEFVIINKKNNINSYSQMIVNTNNILYHE